MQYASVSTFENPFSDAPGSVQEPTIAEAAEVAEPSHGASHQKVKYIEEIKFG